jgi:hypothetical protein
MCVQVLCIKGREDVKTPPHRHPVVRASGTSLCSAGSLGRQDSKSESRSEAG